MHDKHQETNFVLHLLLNYTYFTLAFEYSRINNFSNFLKTRLEKSLESNKLPFFHVESPFGRLCHDFKNHPVCNNSSNRNFNAFDYEKTKTKRLWTKVQETERDRRTWRNPWETRSSGCSRFRPVQSSASFLNTPLFLSFNHGEIGTDERTNRGIYRAAGWDLRPSD